MEPQKTKNGITFFPIPETSDLSMAFGAREDGFFNRHDLPDVPREFEDIANKLFFRGGELPKLSSVIDKDKVRRFIHARLGSFAPAHEAKIATVGYALWLWSSDESLKKENK